MRGWGVGHAGRTPPEPRWFRVLSMTRVSWYILSWTPGICRKKNQTLAWNIFRDMVFFQRISSFWGLTSSRMVVPKESKDCFFLVFQKSISLALQIEDYLLNSQEFTHMIMLDADAALVRHHVDILGGIAQQMFLGVFVGMDSAAVRPGVVSGCKISGRNHALGYNLC